MAKQTILPDPETHSDARSKMNSNFTELYEFNDNTNTNIDTLSSSIDNNTTNNGSLSSAIDNNSTDIDSLSSAIDSNSTDIEALSGSTNNNQSALEALSGVIIDNDININSIAEDIAARLGDNVVVVKDVSDFGVIDSTKEYFIDGVVDTGSVSINIPSTGISLRGYSTALSKLISTDPSYTMFTTPSAGGNGNLIGVDYSIEVSGAGSKVYDLVADSGNEAFELSRVNYNNCSSLGTINGYRQGLETATGRYGGTPELELAGTWAGGYFIDTSIVRGITDGAYSLFKAGPGFLMSSRFRSNQNADLNSSVSLFDFDSSNFVNASTVQLRECLISRNGVFDASDTTIIPNMEGSDLAAAWADNNGIENTFVGGELNISSEVTTVVSSSNTFYNLSGIYTASDMQHFDHPSNGQLRHLGQSPREYSVSGQLVISSGSNNEVDVKIVIYRSETTSFEDGRTIRRVINNLQGGRDVAYYSLSDNIILNTNDYIKVQVSNVNDISDIVAEEDSFINIEAR